MTANAAVAASSARRVAFAPDGKSLFLTSGDRQRFTPAQDPNQPLGKVLHLTLDGKPAPDNPNFGKTGAASVGVINPPADTEAAKTAPVVYTYKFPGKNMTPSETWTTGHRTPYGLAFAPDGHLWEAEHGPKGGDELNLIEKGKNYGWPLVRFAMNYNGVPIPRFRHPARPAEARDLLDAHHRAGQHHLLQGQCFPAVEWFDSAGRHGDHDHQPDRRRRHHRQAGRALECRPPHARYRGRARWFSVGRWKIRPPAACTS